VGWPPGRQCGESSPRRPLRKANRRARARRRRRRPHRGRRATAAEDTGRDSLRGGKSSRFARVGRVRQALGRALRDGPRVPCGLRRTRHRRNGTILVCPRGAERRTGGALPAREWSRRLHGPERSRKVVPDADKPARCPSEEATSGDAAIMTPEHDDSGKWAAKRVAALALVGVLGCALATSCGAPAPPPECRGDPCCGDPCCGDPCCGDPCCGDPCCGDPCCGDPCCGDPCCGDPSCAQPTAPRSLSTSKRALEPNSCLHPAADGGSCAAAPSPRSAPPKTP
jgi:hypothetical protein